MMDLVLWRHAEAEPASDGVDDLARMLTPRGLKQAARMAEWLQRHLPESARVLSSPARRCEQTALALDRKYKVRAELAPDGTVDDLLALVRWPEGKGTTLVIGHQPTLGATLARVWGGAGQEPLPVRKGAIWWLRQRSRVERLETILVSVQSPDML